MNKHIGENIVKCRKLNGISQRFLASRIGISSQGLLKIEKGIVSPRAETLEKIMFVLCITPNQLFGIEQINEESGSVISKLRRLQTQEG